jgi:hypothetical protein
MYWREFPKENVHLEDKGVDGRMGSIWSLGRFAGVVEWILVKIVTVDDLS